MSENAVFKKLLEVQRKLKAPKSQYNQFGKYNYRSAEDILEAVKPVCGEVGAVIFMSDSVRFVEGRHYIEAAVTFADVDTGEFIQVKASAREDESKKGMDGAQLSGATSSYARKYALNGLLDVDDCKDSDEMDGVEARTAEFKRADVVPQEVFFCDLCGNEVTATKKRDGTMWEPKDMAVYSRMKYDGKCLCASCMKAESKKQ
jgi:hypothetical protein